MKRTLNRLTILLLAGALLYACGIIPNANTSFVTIRVGDDPQKAVLKAEAATPWARMKHAWAGLKLLPEAQAYIPSVVQVLVVTVTASDITTPIVGVASVKDTDTSASVRIEVQNGTGRQFLVEGYRGLPSGATQLFYSGTASSDLTGVDVTLPVDMAFVGTGIYVDPTLDPQIADTPSCGTQASPCATITHVLNTRTTTTDNDVILALPGTYKVGSVAAQESFPLALKQGIVLLCRGANFSSIIEVSGTTAILGNERAAVDNCMIRASAGTGLVGGIDDQGTRTKINGVQIELSGSPSVDTLAGAVLSNDSLLLESSVTGSGASLSVYGVKVTGGAPSVIGNTISSLPFGIMLESGGGDALVSGNTISANQTGIRISSTSKPAVENNVIVGNQDGLVIDLGTPVIRSNTMRMNFTGITVYDGFPEITSNSIDHNSSFGVNVSTSSTGNAKINGNAIFCNSIYDVYIPLAQNVIDLQDNAWDHDAGTIPPGPVADIDMNAFSGYDIVYSQSTPTPLFDRIRPAVPNGCVPILPSKPAAR